MSIDLTAITDDQLLREMHERFRGRFCIWQDEDIENALDLTDHKLTPENVEIVWAEIGSSWLEDRMCEVGWDVIYAAIDFAGDKLEKFEED
jgi:hypothetical protein